MNVVVVDNNSFPNECEFPPLAAAKCGWSQYGDVPDDELYDRCWRADIVVSLKKAMHEELLKKLPKLKLIVAPGESLQHIDLIAAEKCGIEVKNTPKLDLNNAHESQSICDQVVQIIDEFIHQANQ